MGWFGLCLLSKINTPLSSKLRRSSTSSAGSGISRVLRFPLVEHRRTRTLFSCRSSVRRLNASLMRNPDRQHNRNRVAYFGGTAARISSYSCWFRILDWPFRADFIGSSSGLNGTTLTDQWIHWKYQWSTDSQDWLQFFCCISWSYASRIESIAGLFCWNPFALLESSAECVKKAKDLQCVQHHRSLRSR